MRRARPATRVEDPDDLDAAEATALRVLGGAAQSAAGLQRRLEQRGYSATAAAHAVERCRELGYINDASLAESVAARHRRSHHGRMRIVADLRARGVDAEAITNATDALAAGEQDEAVAAARALFERLDRRGAVDQRSRPKIGAALQRRGFSGDVIVRALRAID
jgi:regulatory protein